MLIELPWPPSALSPNARGHWSKKAKPAAKYRADAKLVTRKRHNFSGALHLDITFHPPDKRRRDIDNMLSSIKSGLDGISDALGIDDSEWAMTIRKGAVVKRGLVSIEVNQG